MFAMIRRIAVSPLAVTAALVAAIAGTMFVRQVRVHDGGLATRTMLPADATPAAGTEASIRDGDINFYSRRIAEDSTSATDRLTLAGLLYARSRSTGSQGDLAKAETLARQSATQRENRNSQAYALLASILMAQHKFASAREMASHAVAIDPDVPAHLALLGEVELELGDYESAAVHFRSIHVGTQQFTIGARLARWYELTGRIDLARQYLTRAIADVSLRDDLPREQVAWFHYRLGELELRAGRIAAAESAFTGGLKVHPDDVRILGGLARAALARGAADAAIQFGERATFIQLDPATLGTVSQAYAMRGNSVQATSYAQAMSVSALQQPGAIHRAWGLFLLDHGTARDRRTVLARAAEDLRMRKDVYGHDLMAWALFRNGRVDAAQREMQLALAQGTQDVLLDAHARAIGVTTQLPAHAIAVR